MSDLPKDPPHKPASETDEENDKLLRLDRMTLPSPGISEKLDGRAAVVAAAAATGQDEPRLICGIEEAVVEDFLLLIRDNYNRADKAMFFLEQRSGILNLQAITNVRDVLSHLATMLNPKLSEEQRWEQLGNVEEHLRRAIIEPYEIALSDSMEKFGTVHAEYKRLVLPIKDQHPALQHAPNAVSIQASLRQIGDLAAKGRTGKGKNLWNQEWEEGVTSFVEAFDKLAAVHIELEGYLFKAQQIERESGKVHEAESLRAEVTSLRGQVEKEGGKATGLHLGGYILAVLGYVLAILTFAIAVALTLSPTFLRWVQTLFHVE